MKFLIVALALVAVAAAAAEKEVVIVRQVADVHPEGYSYQYETANGISASEDGALKAANNEEGHAIAAQGQFAYSAPDGTPIQIQYVADENGFQPQGAHLPVAPTPPAVPEAILRALEYIRAHPPKEGSK